MVVADLASTNALTPQRVFEIIQGQRGRGFGGGRGGGPGASVVGFDEDSGARGGPGRLGGFGGGGHGGGAGRKTLAQYCADEQLDLQKAMDLLQAKGIKASPDKTLRDIALDNGFDRPFELVEILRAK